MQVNAEQIVDVLRQVTPDLLRWSGAIAKRMRTFNVALEGKHSGNANTDALTLADLTVQELVIAGLRDRAPLLRHCRIEAEEANGDLGAFAEESPLSIALDPIDGTKYFKDKTGNGYAVMIHLRTRDEVLYSLVYAPEDGATGTWTQAYGNVVKSGADDFSVNAFDCLEQMPAIDPARRPDSKKIYLIGFQKNDPANAAQVTAAGLHGYAPDDMPASIYPLLATGAFGGSLIHTPNIYDYPVSFQLARLLGGDSVWVHNGERVNFSETWMDDRADMLRLPGIVATADSPAKLKILCDLARDWSGVRYPE
ncbi:inositol monophosphatase family protein [Planctomicrobium piriforme]|uniref:3'(2'), 5'-bisphosphate nucleotidase n=1 Tax=Planctomicrobium piriforme TaxID=1576369 RepID=A0A1I3GXA8_9PLAN|nr:inositol monophosphatase family protein [Planctomicrobium piriforme]SFI27996.1 3'(2'), 5'-bisphosphate nucleotidase [Planctomicrobium piriforme]